MPTLRRSLAAACVVTAFLFSVATAFADAPLSQGFEDGAPAWSATGMWHVQNNPQAISVAPAIADKLVALPGSTSLPAAEQGTQVAWFGEASTGTYCGSDFASIRQSPQNGCQSTQVQQGTLTSPSFSLVGRASAYMAFRAWWEIEASNADVSDQMRIEYSTDGGTSWTGAGKLNPLDPSWGGWHQPLTNNGARASASWQMYTVDLSGAAGASDVRVRFVFDTIDRLRNGFRGLLLDGVAIVDPLGATITNPGGGPFTDAPPSLTVTGTTLTQDPDGHWSVHITIDSSHPTNHSIGTDWTLTGDSGSPVATGHVDIPAGQTHTTVDVPVSGADGPYTASIGNPTGGATVAPGGSTSTTPGGSLPAVSVDSIGVTPVSDTLVAVTVGVHLSQPAVGPVSVDYTLTGSDGVVAATGTITIPPGLQAGSTTVVVSSLHAPYTVGLSNVRGALLDASASSATTSPLAAGSAVGLTGTGTTTATDLGSQLVLGVRLAGGPILDKTFVLTVVSGSIRYHKPKAKYKRLPSGSVVLPFGSVVDATKGHALITVESDARHTNQEAEVWSGKVGVFQSGTPAVVEMRLAGGDFSQCGSSSRTKAHRSKTKVVRQLWASAKGSFRSKGRFAAATIRGTKWLTQDLCFATRVTVAEGIVNVFDQRRRVTTPVRAGHSITVSALTSGRFKNRRGIHGPKLSRTR